MTDEGSSMIPQDGGGVVITLDVEASSGVVHIVDAVLVPPVLQV